MNKKTLKQVIKEAVRSALNEGVIGNYRGCKNVRLVYHGEWADPELKYRNYIANYNDIEDTLWGQFLDETNYPDNPSNKEVDNAFTEYVKENENEVISLIKEYGEETNDDDETLPQYAYDRVEEEIKKLYSKSNQ